MSQKINTIHAQFGGSSLLDIRYQCKYFQLFLGRHRTHRIYSHSKLWAKQQTKKALKR